MNTLNNMFTSTHNYPYTFSIKFAVIWGALAAIIACTTLALCAITLVYMYNTNSLLQNCLLSPVECFGVGVVEERLKVWITEEFKEVVKEVQDLKAALPH